MTFEPTKYIMQIKGKDYLETKYRLMWFREDHPSGGVTSERISDNPPVFKAYVNDGEGRLLATGHATAIEKGGEVWKGRAVEKAETAAIGRALGHAGYGTQFAVEGEPDDDSEANHLADSPHKGNAQPKNPLPAKPAVQPTSDTAAGNNPLDRGFSVETGRNFMGWCKRNYGLSEENVQKVIDAIAGRELAAITMFPGTIYDAIAGVMLTASKQDDNESFSDYLSNMQNVRTMGPHGKAFTSMDLSKIAGSAEQLAKGS